MNDNLSDIGIRYGTDKVTHGFCEIYDNKFDAFREGAENILEIGVFFGASILMWKDYFKNAIIHGIDTFLGVQGNGHQFANADKFYLQWHNDEELKKQIQLYVCDQSKENDLYNFVCEMKSKGIHFDIIFDDGSHLMRDQQLSLKYLFPLVKNGGSYVIEDVHSSFANYDVLPDYSNTTLSMIERYLGEKKLHSVYTDFTELEPLVMGMELFKINGSITCIIKK